MLEEASPQTAELSLRDYMDMLRRRKAIVIQTFMVVFVLGVAVTFMAKPVYRTSCRILVEGKAFTINSFDSGNPLSAIFSPDSGHDIATQIEVLQGDRVLADAYKDADVPPGSARLDVHEVSATDIIEIVVESNTPTYAERLARALPNTYLNYVTGNRKQEINNAFNFATNRLKEENAKLTQAELALERFKHNAGVVDLETDRDERMTEKGAAEGAVLGATTSLVGSEALLTKLQESLKTLNPSIVTPTETTNPQIAELKVSIANLEQERLPLLILYKPTHPKVMAIDEQIAFLKDRLAKAPATIVAVSKTPNTDVESVKRRIEDLKADIASSKAQLSAAQDRHKKALASLSNYSVLERQQAELMRDIDIHRSTVTLLLKSVEDLGLRVKATHDPVLTIAPAGPAVQVAPKKLNNLVYASLVGLMLGLCFALLQEFLDDRINSPEDARRIVGTPALGYVPMIENEEVPLAQRLARWWLRSGKLPCPSVQRPLCGRRYLYSLHPGHQYRSWRRKVGYGVQPGGRDGARRTKRDPGRYRPPTSDDARESRN